MKVWIARDMDCNYPDLCLFVERPKNHNGMFGTGGRYAKIDSSQFPEIKPGECWEAEITLKKKDVEP
jgi:hypothetical protein